MLLKLGELNKDIYKVRFVGDNANCTLPTLPIQDLTGKTIAEIPVTGTNWSKALEESIKIAEEIIERNNKLEPSNIKKLCDEFTDTVLGFMNKNHLSAGEAIALIETLKFGIMQKV